MIKQKRGKMINKNESKKAQITIFVILALILIVAIALIFVLIKKPGAQINVVEDPQGYIEKCVSDSLTKYEKLMLENNGYVDKKDNYILYRGEKVPYLCKASQFYMPCMSQEPMLLELIRKEIEKNVKKDSVTCFEKLKKELERAGYDVTEEAATLKIEFSKQTLIADINKKITIKKENEIKTTEKFRAEIPSPVYRLVTLAQTIVNFESTLCEFNNVNWMTNYPDISIKRFVTSEQTKVYTLTDKLSSKEFNFAVKTCVLPAGI